MPSASPVGRRPDAGTRGDRTRAAVVAAARDRFAAEGFERATGARIAADAGVSEPSVAFHFGSKAGLLHEVMTDLSSRVAASMRSPEPDENLAELLASTFAASAEGLHWRILTRAMLDGENPADLQEDFPVVARMLEAAGRGTSGPLSAEALVTLIVAASFGMLLFEPYLKLATRQDDKTWKSTRRELMALTMSSAKSESAS